jgi:hypothetical protein
MSDNTALGPNRTLEILRRLCLIVGALLTVWAIVNPCDALFRVRDVNFAKLQKKEAGRMHSDIRMMSRLSGMTVDANDPTINTAPTLQLEQYIARKTKDSLIEVSGSQWSGFFDGVRDTLSGKSQTFIRNIHVGAGSYMLYFPTDAAPLKELAGKLGDNKNFTYVVLRDGDNVRYIEVLHQRPQSAFRDAPNWLLYPLRKQAVWFFILGLLVYAALPWRHKNPDELRYGTARAIVMPDMLGTFMTAAFFALPILVIATNANPSEPMNIFGFSNGWWPLTLVLWLLACFGLCITFVALWYACFTLQITESGFRHQTLFREGEYAFDDMEAIEPAHWAWPSWLRTIAILIGFLNWRALGPILVGSFEEAYGLTIRMKDGRKLKVWISHLPGFQGIFHALRRHNVPLDPELAKIIDQDLAEAAPTPKSGKGGKIAAAILMTLTITGLLTWQYKPEKMLVVKHELQFSYEQLEQRRTLLNEMQKISASMQQALSLPKDATREQSSAGIQQSEELQKQYQELEKRYNAIQPTEED